MIGLSSPLSHKKWCKIQLQLYSQRTAPNYLTSGFNNIHLKCAQQNCMDSPLILHCPFILEPIQNPGNMEINLQWVSQPTELLLNTWQIFKKNITDPICTATARTCQQDCHCSVLWLWVATTVIILSAHLTVTFVTNISVSMCELYNSQTVLCSQTVFDCMYLQILW